MYVQLHGRWKCLLEASQLQRAPAPAPAPDQHQTSTRRGRACPLGAGLAQSHRPMHPETRTLTAPSLQDLAPVPRAASSAISKTTTRLQVSTRPKATVRSVGIAACSPPTCALCPSGAATTPAPVDPHLIAEAKTHHVLLHRDHLALSPCLSLLRLCTSAAADCDGRLQQPLQHLGLASIPYKYCTYCVLAH